MSHELQIVIVAFINGLIFSVYRYFKSLRASRAENGSNGRKR